MRAPYRYRGHQPSESRLQHVGLADFLLNWDGTWRVLSYSEFAAAVSQGDAIGAIEPVRAFLSRMSEQQAKAILDATASTLRTLQAATGIQVAAPITRQD